MKQHADPSRPLREHDAADSPKRQPRPAPDAAQRRQRMDYEREQLQRNRSIEQHLDHALVESFPASDPLAVTPEGTFPVRDPALAPEARGEPGHPPAPDTANRPDPPGSPGGGGRSADGRRHGGQGPRHAQRRADPQTPPQPTDPAPAAPLPPDVPGRRDDPAPPAEPDREPPPSPPSAGRRGA